MQSYRQSLDGRGVEASWRKARRVGHRTPRGKVMPRVFKADPAGVDGEQGDKDDHGADD